MVNTHHRRKWDFCRRSATRPRPYKTPPDSAMSTNRPANMPTQWPFRPTIGHHNCHGRQGRGRSVFIRSPHEVGFRGWFRRYLRRRWKRARIGFRERFKHPEDQRIGNNRYLWQSGGGARQRGAPRRSCAGCGFRATKRGPCGTASPPRRQHGRACCRPQQRPGRTKTNKQAPEEVSRRYLSSRGPQQHQHGPYGPKSSAEPIVDAARPTRINNHRRGQKQRFSGRRGGRWRQTPYCVDPCTTRPA